MPSQVEQHLPLKPLVYSVLLALRRGDDYGYGIAKQIADPRKGGIRLAPSNLYHVLDRMTAKGLIAEARTSDDGRRTYYRLAPLGQDVFRAETERLRALLNTATAHPRGAG